MRALITGITGQDGSYLAEFLLSKGYEVHGLKRRSSSFNTGRLDHIIDRITLHYADLSDASGIWKVLHSVAPNEVYNLAAQSHVRVSFDQPEYTADVTAIGALRLLEGIRVTGVDTKLYQASSSEMFGSSPAPQSESTPFHPRSPYACSKLFAHSTVVNYRESYGMFACSGILFNHESPRRGETFVTRKITMAVARIKRGLQTDLILGNLEARRDWGYAGEYVEAMWRMLQQPNPIDYVIGTGETHSVVEFAEAAFARVGLDWRDYVRTDPRYWRPAEVDELQADPSHAARRLHWTPKLRFRALVNLMVDADMEALTSKAAA